MEGSPTAALANMLPHTLPELLHLRAQSSSAIISFLDASGTTSSSLTYQELYDASLIYAQRLLAAGLSRSSIVLASFLDHESHIRLFWACCLAGIIYCPLPRPHPDQSRQKLLFDHLQSLFQNPTIICSESMLLDIETVTSNMAILTPSSLPAAEESNCTRIYPSVFPAPREPVCLMLTSGSTGNSKAVVLRHTNLLSCIRGKSTFHETSSTSRFLNWIAFDHVACVSEIFLHALYANASQWHIAPEFVIKNPLLLLTLSTAYKISYTFSPNFLLAQLLRDTGETSSLSHLDLTPLRAFISGGEAVPMKTAIAFADLLQKAGASRNVLRAGFGMSETGAGCIYNRHPVPGSLMETVDQNLSLGTCCNGVEIRIIDSASDGEGESLPFERSGLLQIRGPTVFTEYFGNFKATSESFTAGGWFTTGDLGIIDRQGNLHLVGREKDCININGVKYNPHDIIRYIQDTHISGVVSSHIYVSPTRLEGADTETYVVFYQHEICPLSETSSEQRSRIIATTQKIKDTATIFCSSPPHVVLPLPAISFVRSSLGKVSSGQLLKSFQNGDFHEILAFLQDDSAAEAPRLDMNDAVESVVANVLSDVFSLDASTLRPDQNIFDLGASSMHLLRARQALQDRLSISELSTIELLKRPRIGDLCDYLRQVYTKAVPHSHVYQPLVRLKQDGTKPPLFLIHPGVGEVLVFIQLAQILGDNRPVYALRARGFEQGDEPFQSFQEMVDCYVSTIKAEYPQGPYYIAGYSLGGAISYEIAKALEQDGRKVAFLGILNLPPFIQFRLEQLNWTEILLHLGMFLSLFSESQAATLRTSLLERFPECSHDTLPSDISKPVHYLFAHSDINRLQQLDLKKDSFSRWVSVAHQVNRISRTYAASGKVKASLSTIFCATPLGSMGTREQYKVERLSPWRDFCETMEMVDVDGEHYTMLSEENVVSFSKHLKGALSRAESRC